MSRALSAQIYRTEELINKRGKVIQKQCDKLNEEINSGSKPKTHRKYLRKLSFLTSLVFILNAFSLAALSAWLMGGIFVFSALVFGNISRANPNPFLKKLAVGICLAAMLLAAPVTANNLTTGLRAIGDQALSKGPESLSYLSRFGLWWSAVWLSIGGVAYGAPYTVAEQVLMFWPGPKERLWNDNFPAKAQKIKKIISNSKFSAGNHDKTFKTDLLWKSYCQDNCDVGLALNGGDLTVEITDKGLRCIATARVSVSYKPQYRSSTILGYGKYWLSIDQAAYWSLQELGWLFPFTLRYRWGC
jgi:hypothetical protein